MSGIPDLTSVLEPADLGQGSGRPAGLTHEKERFPLYRLGVVTVMGVPLRAVKAHLIPV